ncbi:putative Ig domain-containing protein [Gemmatimonadales bacterium]|nr:putative Ig domain-containing protein [Gemmatimonadales bacterium]
MFALVLLSCAEQVTLPEVFTPPSIQTPGLPDAEVGASYSATLTAIGGNGSYSWSVISGFPSWLSLSNSGTLTGIPDTASEFTIGVSVTSQGLSAERTLQLRVDWGPPEILTAELSPATIGDAYGDTLRATGGDGSYVWSTISGELPAGVKLRNETGVLSGRARSIVEADLRFQVTSAEKVGQADLTLSARYPAPTIITTELTDAEVGVEHNQSLVAQGGDGENYSWSEVSGALPEGLSLSETGDISGTPVRSDTSTVVIRVTSGERSTESVLEMATVAGPLSITTDSLPNGEIGTAYNQAVEVVGGDGTNYMWSKTGELPDGLGLSTDGVISGSPTTSGTSNFTLRVISGSEQGDKSFAITIVDTLAISTSSLADGTLGQSYSQVLSAVGGTGTYTWSLTEGALPQGMTLSPAGAISGTPTSVGTSSFLVTVTSGGISASGIYSIAVNDALVISEIPPPNGVKGVGYETVLGASGGDGSYSWVLLSGSLPTGLSLSAQGLISGTPTAAGTDTASVQVMSAGQTTARSISITVAEGLTIATNGLPDGSVGVAYNQSLSAQAGDGTYTWSLSSGSLPGGLSLSTAGVISGTPTADGTSGFTVQVSSGGLTATKDLSIVTYDGVQIVSVAMRQGLVGIEYADTLTAVGGDGSYSWSLPSVVDVPDGLSVTSAGVVSGTPTSSGTSSFNVEVISAGDAASGTVSIEVLPTLSITGPVVLKSQIVGHPYSDTLSAIGGDGSYAWTIQAGSLPSGLSLSSAGVISGMPTGDGVATFTVRVSSAGATADAGRSITIVPVVSVSTSALPDGAVDAAYNDSLTAIGGDGSYSWFLASGSLPSGLGLSSSGVISGTPTATDTASFTASVVSAGDTASAALSLSVRVLGQSEIPFGGTVSGISGDAGFRTWTTEVPEGTASLVVELSGGSHGGYSYPDLYIAQGTSVGRSYGQYDCHDTGYPSRCVIENPEAGTFSILMEATGWYDGVTLSVNPDPETVTFGGPVSGISGDAGFRTWTTEVPEGTASLVVELSGGSHGGYSYPDLYVARGTSAGTSYGQYDCRDTGYPSRCVIENPEAGTFSILMDATGLYSGVTLRVTGTVTSSGWDWGNVKTISSGYRHSCGLTTGGDAYCWGNYLNPVDSPVAVPTPVLVPGGHTWSSITAGYEHTVGITTNGVGYAWGRNTHGQLGIGAATVGSTIQTPTQILGGHTWSSISIGSSEYARHTVGITESGAAYAWGDNSHGQLGIGGNLSAGNYEHTPVLITGDVASAGWLSVSAGSYHTVGLLKPNGRAASWGGWNAPFTPDLLLGTGSGNAYPSPVYISAPDRSSDHGWTAMSASRHHSCGIAGGVAYCWGLNTYGQLGIGNTLGQSENIQTRPKQINGSTGWTSISAGDAHTVGIRGGAAYAWGSLSSGRIGNGGSTTGRQWTQTAVSGGHSWQLISAGGAHTLGITTSGVGYGWGHNIVGQLGDGTTTSRSTPGTPE